MPSNSWRRHMRRRPLPLAAVFLAAAGAVALGWRPLRWEEAEAAALPLLPQLRASGTALAVGEPPLAAGLGAARRAPALRLSSGLAAEGEGAESPAESEGAGAGAAASEASDTTSGSSKGAGPGAGKKLLVLGGGGFVGSEVCRIAVARGYQVTSLSRRGQNPDPGDKRLASVQWVKGNAADLDTVKTLVSESDAVIHAIGLLFDVNSGLTGLNIVVSGSNSVPDEESTYDTVTRKTAFNLIDAVQQKFRLPWESTLTPVLFVSAAEAGWPEVTLGEQVENIAPAWLREYLTAKRAVEAKLSSAPEVIRPVIFRPSLIWDWTKFDVLPVIPVFNLLSAIGVPFVDKTVTVKTLASAIVAGLENEAVSGVQRFSEMEELEKSLA